MAFRGKFEEHDKLLKKTAWKVLRRAKAGGLRTMTFEDIYQELVCAWCVARDNFDETLQVPFGAYLTRGLYLYINRFLDKEFRERGLAPLSLDDQTFGGDESEGEGLHEVIADARSADVEQLASETSIRRLIAANLSERARQFLDLLERPPQAVVDQHNAMRMRADFGRARGIQGFVPKHVSASVIFDLMGAPQWERTAIMRDLEDLGRRISQC